MPPPLLLRNATLIDGTGAPPRADSDLLIENGRLTAVGRVEHPPAGGEVRDLGGRSVLPGLIDCHVHLTTDGNADDVAKMAELPAPDLAWIASENARRTLHAGVTTVRDLGARDSINIRLREAINAGRLPGPRMRAVGAIVCITGGHGWFVGRQADGPDEVRKAVREQLRAGADAIKFTATGGVMTPGVDPRSPSFTREELRAGIEEAHNAFRRTAAHAQGTAGIKNAVAAGIDSIEHGIFLDDEVIETMRRQGTFFVPTLAAPFNISRHGLAAGIPAYAVEKSDRVREAHNASFKEALRAGVRIAMGTDAGTPFNRHGENAQELALMVECGMTPLDAITASTKNAAELLDFAGETGTLEAGCSADLIIINADPLADITRLQYEVAAVMKAGVWVRELPAAGS